MFTSVCLHCMREASNAKQVIACIILETGVDLKIISALEEAEIIASADNTSLNEHQKYKMFVDLGGGSLELYLLQNHSIIKSKSFEIGAIRYVHNKIEDKEWDSLKKWLREFTNDFNKILLIGSGGNINKIAKVYGLKEKKMISLTELKYAKAHLSSYSLQDRIEKLGISPNRADLTIPACKIFIKIMKWINSEKICVPGIGLADGLIYKLYKEYIADY
jgi:exopolyphosphatase / guanosine-5'-triphosphate,3'-diphosphate pyrophosphatase